MEHRLYISPPGLSNHDLFPYINPGPGVVIIPGGIKNAIETAYSGLGGNPHFVDQGLRRLSSSDLWSS